MWAGCSELSRASCHTVGTRPGATLTRAGFGAKSGSASSGRCLPRGRVTLVDAVARRQSQGESGATLFDSYGGAINRVAPHATAFCHRAALDCIQYLTYSADLASREPTV